MVKDGIRNPWKVRENEVEVSQVVKDRMGGTCVTIDVENGMLLPKSTEIAKGSLSASG